MSVWNALQQRAERRMPALTRWRQPETLPATLHRRRIYVLPTTSGIGFGVLLVVMLLGALNYQNNAALLLTCLLGAALINSMLVAFRALDGLTLTSLRTNHAFAGDPLTLHLGFDSAQRTRRALCIDLEDEHVAFSIDRSGGEAAIAMSTAQRGWNAVPRMRLSCTLPFGLFRAWSWVTPTQSVLVYPRPLDGPPPPPSDDDARARRRGEEEYAGLRDYRYGDALKRVAWKASARHERLLIRELDAAASRAPVIYDWDMLHGLDRETRISRLAGWIRAAHASARTWTLVLPDRHAFGPDADHAHYHRSMTALALLPP